MQTVAEMPTVEVLDPLPQSGIEPPAPPTTNVVDVGDPSEDEPPSMPAKLLSDFVVEFLEADKKKSLPGAEDACLYVTDVYMTQVAAETMQRRKKRRKTQEEMPWGLTLTFADDLDNKAADFLDSLKTLESEFRIRVLPINAQGRAVEAFVFKDVTIKQLPRSYAFTVHSKKPRTLELQLAAVTCRRKSLTKAE